MAAIVQAEFIFDWQSSKIGAKPAAKRFEQQHLTQGAAP
jgi:hypothetical protein